MKCFILILAFVCAASASARFFIGGRNYIYSWNQVARLCKAQGGRIAEPANFAELAAMSNLAGTKKSLSLIFTGIRNVDGQLQYSHGKPVKMDIPCGSGCVSPAFWSHGQNPVDTRSDLQRVPAYNAVFSLVTPICQK